MPSIESIKTIMTETLRHDPSVVFHIEGTPGSGKTDLCTQVAHALGVSDNRIFIFRPSLHDPVDLMGVPSVVNGATVWNTPADFAQFAEGTGPGVIIWDETNQGITMMQNAIAGAMLDKFIGPLRLDRQVIQISTGNRAKDKAGSKDLPTQLGNRVNRILAEAGLDDWCSWAMANGVDPMGVAFIRLRPGLLNDFDPNRQTNPTPRSWTQLFTKIPSTLPRDLYLYAAEGYVGEGPATEWVAAKDMMQKMPSIDYILMQPDKAEVPAEPAIQYAVSTALGLRPADTFERAMPYMERMPKEQQMLYVSDMVRIHKAAVQNTKTFIDWSIKNKDLFMSSN